MDHAHLESQGGQGLVVVDERYTAANTPNAWKFTGADDTVALAADSANAIESLLCFLTYIFDVHL
jgi:hypothetical protein